MRAFEPGRWRGQALLGLLALGLASCLANPVRLAPIEVTGIESTAPLTGEALEQRKREMQRASRDLAHFGATLASLRLHPQGPNSTLSRVRAPVPGRTRAAPTPGCCRE